MIKTKLILVLHNIDGFCCNAYLDALLAAAPLVGYVIDVRIPNEFKTNFAGHDFIFPTNIANLSTEFHIVKMSVRGVVFQTDGAINVWIGPDLKVNYPIGEIADHFRSAGWDVPASWYSEGFAS
jgi:hypothetical protein